MEEEEGLRLIVGLGLGLGFGFGFWFCVCIRFFGNGYWRFRSYSGSLLEEPGAGPAKSNQKRFAPPLGASPRLGMPERRPCSVGPLHKACVRPSWLTGRRNLRPPRGGLRADLVLGGPRFPCGSEPAREGDLTVDDDVGCTGLFASRLAPTGFCGKLASGGC